jgi:hypothetical protein
MDHLEFISSLKWYIEVKNLCLKNALAVRCPLSVIQLKDLRLYYSQYFSGLLAATEMLLEKDYIYRDKFKLKLEATMCFDSHPDGKKNYSYIRELRNSIIHRGFDISSAAHIIGDFPRFVAPQIVKNRSGNENYHAFAYYLLDVISKCESNIPKAIRDHLEEEGLLQPIVSEAEMATKYKQSVYDSVVMPNWVKDEILSNTQDFILVEHQKILTDGLIIELENNVINSFKIDCSVD